MKLNLEINNAAKSPVKKDFLAEIVKETLAKSGCDFLKLKTVSVSVALVAPSEIKKLNRIYRKKNSVTDILSFPEYESASRLKKEKKGAIFLGELVICPDDIKEYAKSNKFDYEKELAKTISHGILHLLGFKHGRKMFSVQEKTSKNL